MSESLVMTAAILSCFAGFVVGFALAWSLFA